MLAPTKAPCRGVVQRRSGFVGAQRTWTFVGKLGPRGKHSFVEVLVEPASVHIIISIKPPIGVSAVEVTSSLQSTLGTLGGRD